MKCFQNLLSNFNLRRYVWGGCHAVAASVSDSNVDGLNTVGRCRLTP